MPVDSRDLYRSLIQALTEWNVLIGSLRHLASRQRDLLAGDWDGKAFTRILQEKQSLYRKADEASRCAAALEAQWTETLPLNEDATLRWSEIDGIKQKMQERLLELEGLEIQSRKLLKERMHGLQSEMENLGRNRTVLHAYGGGSRIGSPRFLDQRR